MGTGLVLRGRVLAVCNLCPSQPHGDVVVGRDGVWTALGTVWEVVSVPVRLVIFTMALLNLHL